MNPLKTKFFLLFSLIIVIALASASCEGPVGPEGPQGQQGEQGPPGPVGPAGTDGSIIHAGEGAPDPGTGKPGDFYLDLTTGNLFGPKMAEGWGVPTNLQGQDGPQGEQGPQGPAGEDGQDGEQGPQGPAGEDGQDGQDGKDGSQIFAGKGAPDDGLGKKGDYYLDKASYDLYGPKTSSGWGSPVNLQGPKGDPGPQGPEGPAGTTDHSMLTGLSADDHTQYLLVDGVRDATDGFAVTGESGTGNIPVEGEGARLMWYPGKAAFRAGFVGGDQWNDANIGEYSTAMGQGTTANGNFSTAMGAITTASANFSTAMGSNTAAEGNYSTAMGGSTTASGNFSTAMGQQTTASGGISTAMGSNTSAEGNNSTAMGAGTTASGGISTAMGQQTTASSQAATAMGLGTTAASLASLSIGKYNSANTTSDNTLFVVGNGAFFSNPSDALVLDQNGNLEIAGILTENSDRRLKTEIVPLGTGILDKLSDIHPVRYRFRGGTGHSTDPQLGLIAQEVQAHFPELVSTGSEGYLSLSYSKLTTVLLKGMQEQQAEIERLQAKANRVDELEARLARLEGERGQERPAYTSAAFPGSTGRWLFAGLALLVATGGAYAMKKLHGRKE